MQYLLFNLQYTVIHDDIIQQQQNKTKKTTFNIHLLNQTRNLYSKIE